AAGRNGRWSGPRPAGAQGYRPPSEYSCVSIQPHARQLQAGNAGVFPEKRSAFRTLAGEITGFLLAAKDKTGFLEGRQRLAAGAGCFAQFSGEESPDYIAQPFAGGVEPVQEAAEAAPAHVEGGLQAQSFTGLDDRVGRRLTNGVHGNQPVKHGSSFGAC